MGVINSVKFIRRYDDLYFMRNFLGHMVLGSVTVSQLIFSNSKNRKPNFWCALSRKSYFQKKTFIITHQTSSLLTLLCNFSK